MDQATLQTKVAKGYGKAAVRLGATTTQYRPTSVATPLGTAHATFLAAFNNDAGFSFKQPTPWGKPMVYGLFDTTDVAAGDLLVSGSDTYFVARFEAYQPPLCVLCNNALTFSPGTTGSNGSASSGTCAVAGVQPGYSGIAASEGAVTGAWPCSLLLRRIGQVPNSGIPGAQKPGDYEILLPIMPDFQPEPYMTAVDRNGQIYTIEAVEISQFGYKLWAVVQQF